MIADKDELEKLVTRWKLPADNPRSGLVAQLLENQQNWFNSVEIPDSVEENFGPDWRQVIYDAITKAWFSHPLPDLCSMQPANGPLDKIFYFQPHNPGIQQGAQTYSLQIASDDIQLHPRKVKARIEIAHDYSGIDQEILEYVFEELLTDVSREILCTMLNSADDSARITETTSTRLLDDIGRASHLIHRNSQRAPANNIVANERMLVLLGMDVPISNGQVQKIGTLERKWTVYLDPYFPKGNLLLWYNGPSHMDSAIIYSPYQYNFAPFDDSGRKYVSRVRHKISMLKPDYVHIVRFNVLERMAKAVEDAD